MPVQGDEYSAQMARLDSGPRVDLPPAGIVNRLGGSGIEFATYGLMALGLSLVGAITVGMSDPPITLLLIAMIAIRDTNSGALSLAKRIGMMRVVKRPTGLPISNYDALMRNIYYLVICAVFVVPSFNLVPLILLFLFVAADVLLILFSEKRIRIGDWLASTQVVEIEEDYDV